MVCDMQETGENNVYEVITIKAKGDEIYKYVSNIIIDYEESFVDSGYTDEEKVKFFNQQLDLFKNKYDYKGIDFKGEISGDKLNITISIDLNKVSQKSLLKIDFLSEGNDKGYFSLENTADGLESTGGKCEEK